MGSGRNGSGNGLPVNITHIFHREAGRQQWLAELVDLTAGPHRCFMPGCVDRQDPLKLIQRNDKTVRGTEWYERVACACRPNRQSVPVCPGDNVHELIFACRGNNLLRPGPYAARPVDPIWQIHFNDGSRITLNAQHTALNQRLAGSITEFLGRHG